MEVNPHKISGVQRYGLFLACFTLCVLFHQRYYDAPTPLSRLQLIFAVALEGRIEIDSFHETTPDKALVNGHFYSDKAPGTSLLAALTAVPIIWWMEARGVEPHDCRLWLCASWAGSAVLALLLSGGYVALANTLLLFVDKWCAIAAATFIVFGTLAYPYVTSLFSHGLVVGSLLLALNSLLRSRGNADGLRRRDLFWAGIWLGVSLCSEYTAGVIVMGMPLMIVGFQARALLVIACGMAGPCLLIPAYSLVTIGNPFDLPYSYQASFPEMRHGLYAIGLPSAPVAWKLLFSAQRGLLVTSPFLALAAIGYRSLPPVQFRLFGLTYLLPVIHLVIISGRAWDWPAGPCHSARYLAPAIPLLAIPCALGLKRFPWLGHPLGLFSVILTFIVTTTMAWVPYSPHIKPLIEVQIPLLLRGDFNPNLLTLFFGIRDEFVAIGVLVSVLAFTAAAGAKALGCCLVSSSKIASDKSRFNLN